MIKKSNKEEPSSSVASGTSSTIPFLTQGSTNTQNNEGKVKERITLDK
jgi:hypothetical protein